MTTPENVIVESPPPRNRNKRTGMETESMNTAGLVMRSGRL